MDRRTWMQLIGVLAAARPALTQDRPPVTTTPPATPQPPAGGRGGGRGNQPPPRFTREQVQAALKLLGLEFQDAEIDMMLRNVDSALSCYEAVRKIDIPLDTEPSFTFHPGLPDRVPIKGPQRQFLRLADDSPAMIWTSGPDTGCDYVNRAWLSYRGRTADQETGGGWVEGLHPDDRDLCLETYLRAFHSRQPFRMQFRLQRADESYSWVESA